VNGYAAAVPVIVGTGGAGTVRVAGGRASGQGTVWYSNSMLDQQLSAVIGVGAPFVKSGVRTGSVLCVVGLALSEPVFRHLNERNCNEFKRKETWYGREDAGL